MPSQDYSNKPHYDSDDYAVPFTKEDYSLRGAKAIESRYQRILPKRSTEHIYESIEEVKERMLERSFGGMSVGGREEVQLRRLSLSPNITGEDIRLRRNLYRRSIHVVDNNVQISPQRSPAGDQWGRINALCSPVIRRNPRNFDKAHHHRRTVCIEGEINHHYSLPVNPYEEVSQQGSQQRSACRRSVSFESQRTNGYYCNVKIRPQSRRPQSTANFEIGAPVRPDLFAQQPQMTARDQFKRRSVSFEIADLRQWDSDKTSSARRQLHYDSGAQSDVVLRRGPNSSNRRQSLMTTAWPERTGPYQDLSAVRRLMSNESSSSSHPPNANVDHLCPTCGLPFDKGKKRRLVDTCGHQRCYSCMFKRQECPICANANGSSPAKLQKSGSGNRLSNHLADSNPFPPSSPSLSLASSRFGFGARSRTQSPSLHGPISSQTARSNAIYQQQQIDGKGFQSSTPSGRRRYVPSPKLFRSPWLQHQRRSHLLDPVLPNVGPQSSDPSSHSRESGFQSGTSLCSLDAAKIAQAENSPVSTLTGSLEEEEEGEDKNNKNSNASHMSADSMCSLISGLSDSASTHLGSRRHSLTTLRQNFNNNNEGEEAFGNRKALGRRSARFTNEKTTENSVGLPQLRQLYWTLKPLFFEVPTCETSSLFMGRHWLFREISDHLTSDLPTNRGVIITGAAGTGKTAIILQMVEQSCFGRGEANNIELPMSDTSLESIYGQSQLSLALPTQQPNSLRVLSSQIVAYHFCQADNAPTCLVPEFVHSVAAQMSQAPQLTPYYQLVNSDPNIQSLLSLPGCVADPSNAFVSGILEPLHALRRLGRLSAATTCIIVIDGLCDAEVHRPDHGFTLASFLAKHLSSFPDWLKIVCSVKTQMQEITKALPFQRISLDKTDVDERLNKDMTDYIMLRINRSVSIQTNITPTSVKIEGSPKARITQYLTQVARGCFLYVKMTLDLIERGYLVIKSSSFNVLPMSLAQIYLLEFNLKFPSLKSFEKVQDILSTALAALTPLTPIELFNSINALSTGSAIPWGEFLMRFSALSGFLVRRADDTVMFCHPTFREWLIRRQNFESKKFVCDPRTGHAAISFRMCRGEPSLSPDQTLELGHHILKAHIYKSQQEEMDIPARDLQAMWVAMTTDDVSIALGAVRNVSNPNVKVSRLLLLAGASPDHISDYHNNAPLMSVFSSQGYIDMVSLLIEFGADINAVNSGGMTPLMFASKQGHLDLVRMLVQQGATINLIDKCEMSALVFAARAGHLNTISFLVSCDWVTDSVNDLGLEEAAQQAMVVSAEKGHEQVLEFLLDMSEVKVNHSDTLTGNTALCAAASSGQKRCVEILLRRGAKVTLTNLKEATPLHMAIAGGHWDVTEALLKEGAGLEQTDSQGRTPLMIAAMEGHTGVLELLISKQVLIEAKDNTGLNALGWACLKGRVQAVSCLLDQGADVNHPDKSGRSPLDLASYKGDPDIVQLLLDRGAVMEHTDVNGMRPLDRAISAGHAAVIQCFLKKGAKLGPATWSMANDKPEILLILLNKLLEDGNTLYRKNRFSDAAHRYNYALRRLPKSEDVGKSNVFDQLKVHLLLNLSRCKRKLGETTEAISKATEVLAFRPSSLEAWHARARAYKEDGQFEAAIQDLTEALKISPQNREVHKFIIKVKEEMAKNNNVGPVGAGEKSEQFQYVDDSAASSVAGDTKFL